MSLITDPRETPTHVVTPIFILSLPRSGSTLLQRLIATHPAVATTNEPWLLLPLLLGYREGHVVASYRQRHLAAAFEDFLGALPDGEASHRRAVRRFAATLYGEACGPEHTHFVDKTPRYHLIADELPRVFPDARFVLLWRHPLAVAASCVETWGGGQLRLHDHRLDLFDGLARLIEASRAHPDRFLAVRYEDLVVDPEGILERVFAHCGVSVDGAAEVTERLGAVALDGHMGDPKAKASARVSQASRDAWPAAWTPMVRRAWARRYLRWLGAERLAVMGYDWDETHARLAAPRPTPRHLLSDLFWLAQGAISVHRQTVFRRRRRRLAQEGRTPSAHFE